SAESAGTFEGSPLPLRRSPVSFRVPQKGGAGPSCAARVGAAERRGGARWDRGSAAAAAPPPPRGARAGGPPPRPPRPPGGGAAPGGGGGGGGGPARASAGPAGSGHARAVDPGSARGGSGRISRWSAAVGAGAAVLGVRVGVVEDLGLRDVRVHALLPGLLAQ